MGIYMAPPDDANAIQNSEHNPERNTQRNGKAVEVTGGNPKIETRA